MSYSADLDVRVTDSSLPDGSHAIRHQFTIGNVRSIVAALDDAGVPVIEVTHGDGLGGSSFNYGFSAVPDQDLMSTAVATARQAKIAFLMLPGVGITDDIRQAADNGASVCRIATHCTEADISIQHFKVARSIGLETVGFLMVAHSQPPEVLARQARIMADAGAQCVYVVDSAGSLIMDGVTDRIAALVAELGDDAQVGFHGHENLGLGVANSVLAARAGAKQIDGSTRRFGAGTGNIPVEAFAAVTERLGIKTGIDTLKIVDAAEETVAPVLSSNPPELNRLSLTMGYAGVYSSFLKHAEIQARKYGVSGQGCTNATRILLPRVRMGEGLAIMRAAMEQFPYGGPWDMKHYSGPAISDVQRDKVPGMIEGAVAAGATLVTGGGKPAHLPRGYYIEPTLLADVDPLSVIGLEETFGPVVTVTPYDTEDEAVAIANDTVYGLAGQVSSGDDDHALASR